MRTASRRVVTKVKTRTQRKTQKLAIVKSEPPSLAENIEKVLIGGDLTPLKPEERLEYYKAVCRSLGLNPLTKPFAYIVFRENDQGPGKLTLYATKDCTEQLRKMYGVGVVKLEREIGEETCLVEATVRDKFGKPDVGTGVVSLYKFKDGKRYRLEGRELCNAIMKAETKAKRRATLSVCGLGFLDESEIDTLTDYNMLTEAGRLIHEIEERGTPAAAQKVAQQKLLANASGTPMSQQTAATPQHAEPVESEAKLEQHKQKAAASVTQKVVEIYPTKLGDVDILAFVDSPALAFLCDNGLKDLTVWAPTTRVRYMADDPAAIALVAKVAASMGVTVKRVAAPKPTGPAAAPESGPGCMAAPPANIPPFKAPAGAPPPPQPSGNIIESCARRKGGKNGFLSVMWGGKECSCWHQSIWEAIEASVGQPAEFEILEKEKGGTVYRNIESIKRIGTREYADNLPVRNMNDMGQAKFF